MEQQYQELLENIVKHTQIFRNFFPGIFVALSEKQQFPALPEISQKMSKPLVQVGKFKEFLVEWKAPNF